ncbi:MAG TPA: DUF4384 domain-containing protein [Blastocatellia bacterium]|nr:DUF4384 domain-containing protein [Blastocatellia bacterium]
MMRMLKFCSVIGVIAGLVLIGPALAQKQGAKLWYATATINRKEKPNRKRKTSGPIKKRVKASLLTLQWHLLKRGDGNVKEPVDPNLEFETGDQIKLAITANQDGYLYIINQEEGKDGILLFPDPNVNDGKNEVKKDQQYVIPYSCSDKPNPEDCWMTMFPPAGTENLILIFSRDQITTLPNEVKNPGDRVSQAAISELIATASKKVTKEFDQNATKLDIPGQPAIRFATRVRNTDLDDNEELITNIQIRHGG